MLCSALLCQAFQDHLLKLSDLAKLRDQGNWTTQPDVLPEEAISVEKRRAAPIQSKRILEFFTAYSKAKRLDDGGNRNARRVP